MRKPTRIPVYGVFAACVVLLSALIARQRPWVADFWLHAVTVDRLSADPLNPGNPAVLADTGSPYYTPYTFLLGLLARVTGLSGVDILTLWAPVNVALLLIGVRAFAGRFGRSPWLAIALFVSMVLVWGTTPLGWSGFMSLYGLPLIMAYPSTFVFALTLMLWAMLLGFTERPFAGWRADWRRVAGIAGLAALIVLSHQFTATLAALGAVAILASRWRTITRLELAGMGAAAGAVLAAALVWPYYNTFELLGLATALDSEHEMLFSDWFGLYGYVVLALPLLVWRWARDRFDVLVLMFLAGLVVVVYGAVSGHWSWGRMIPLAAFAGQAAIAFAVVEWVPRLWQMWETDTVMRVALCGVAALLVLVGLRNQGGNLLYAAPISAWPQRIVEAAKPTPRAADYSWVAQHVQTLDVIATSDRDALRAIPAYGPYLVGPSWPDPLLPDENQRRADQAAIMDQSTPPEIRALLIAKYKVRWILVTSLTAGAPADLTIREAKTGPHGQALLRVAD